MAILKFDGKTYDVDHAVKGADFVHGYDADGNIIISIEGVSDFSVVEYNSSYMRPEECITEGCNAVKYYDGRAKTNDGRVLKADSVGARPDTWMPTASDVGAATPAQVNSAVKKAAPRNLLDNSDFRNLVNQKGQDSYTAGTYTIDRWYLGLGSVTINDNSISINNGYIIQTFEGLDTTQEYTLAWCNDGVVAIQQNPIRTDLGLYPAIVLDTGWMKLDKVQWAALYEGKYTIDTLPEYQPKGYENELLVCRQYDPRTDEYIGLRKFGQPRNLLDNSDFRNPVNQRGFSSDTIEHFEYCIDRWCSYSSSNVPLSVSLSNGGITLAQNVEAELTQFIPNISKYTGKTLTVAVGLADGTFYCNSGTVSELAWNRVARISEKRFDATLHTFDGNRGAVFIRPIEDVTVAWVAVYEGEYTIDTLPEYQTKGYGAELFACKRYYRVLSSDPTLSGYIGSADTTVYVLYPEKTDMREDTSIDVIVPGAIDVICNGIYYRATVVSAICNHSQFSLNVQYQDGSPPARMPCMIFAYNKIQLSADL